MEESKKSSRLVERTRIAKMRFLNSTLDHSNDKPGTVETTPELLLLDYDFELDLSVPGTTVCSKYVTALNERKKQKALEEQKNLAPNPFDVFLESIDTPPAKTKAADTIDILGLLIEEQNAKADNDRLDNYGYDKVGMFNGSSNLRVYPAVQRSYSRRYSEQEKQPAN